MTLYHFLVRIIFAFSCSRMTVRIPFFQVDPADIPISMTNDMTPGIDKLNTTPYCKEYSRLGFGSLFTDSSGKSGPWRISMVNLTYAACRR